MINWYNQKLLGGNLWPTSPSIGPLLKKQKQKKKTTTGKLEKNSINHKKESPVVLIYIYIYIYIYVYSVLSVLFCGQPEQQNRQFCKFSFFCWLFWPRLGDLCQSPIGVDERDFLGQVLGCAYTICSYGQI